MHPICFQYPVIQVEHKSPVKILAELKKSKIFISSFY